MKKIIAVLLAVCMSATALFGCGGSNGNENQEEKTGISIVTTVFPIYDWVKNLTAGVADVEIDMLLDNGVDLHSFQPTAQDLMKISTCDLFIYVGGESDEWVEDALKNATNEKMAALNLLELLGESALEEEEVEGMEPEKKEEESEEEGPEYDEHIWLSLKNAKVLTEKIKDALCQADAKNIDAYEKAWKDYDQAITDLDTKFSEELTVDGGKVLVFGDRFPFLYLTRDYDFQYFAAFKGCSAESEASFETICFLASKVDEYKLKHVMCLEGSDQSIAKTIIDNTESKDAEILTLNSMQSTTGADVEGGANYLDIMKENLETLKKTIQ